MQIMQIIFQTVHNMCVVMADTIMDIIQIVIHVCIAMYK